MYLDHTNLLLGKVPYPQKTAVSIRATAPLDYSSPQSFSKSYLFLQMNSVEI